MKAYLRGNPSSQRKFIKLSESGDFDSTIFHRITTTCDPGRRCGTTNDEEVIDTLFLQKQFNLS